MRFFNGFGFLLVALVWASPASAERIALLIGNADYSEAVGELSNPHNDVAAIRSALLLVGFEDEDITTVTDTSRISLLRAVRAFGAKAESLTSEDIAFFYYSGHGARHPLGSGMSLIPVDVQTVENEDFWFETVALDDVIEQFVGPRGNRSPAAWVLAIDACRNELRLPQRALGGGAKSFGAVPTTSGMLISFAADEGQTAADHASESATLSPYAKVLSEELTIPGRPVSSIFGAVRPGVRSLTGAAQQPVVTNKLNFDPVLIALPSDPSIAGRNTDERDWQRFTALDTIDGYNAYLSLHPNGQYVERAQAQLERLKAEPAAAPPPAMFLSGAPQYQPGDEFRDSLFGGGEGPLMVVIPKGNLLMGSPYSEPERYGDEGPQVQVSISKPFAVGKFEITWDEWNACVADEHCNKDQLEGTLDDEGWSGDDHPVMNVSWNDAQLYIAWLSEKTGQSYRLLTEAEWEYAARGGPTAAYWWGSTPSRKYGNYGADDCCGGVAEAEDLWVSTSPVGSFPKNPYGLHDMNGNVWEWVEDCKTSSLSDQPTDGSAKITFDCATRVLRGGSWYTSPFGMRSAYRNHLEPSRGNFQSGFRVARELD